MQPQLFTTALRSRAAEYSDSRRRVYEILEISRDGDSVGRFVDISLIILIAISVSSVILESIPSLEAAYTETFFWVEVITVACFTVEYFLRLWSVVEKENTDGLVRSPFAARIRYFFSPYAVIDLLAVLPFYLMMVSTLGHVDMRFLRCIRLLRILKLTRYSSAFDTLIRTFRENMRSLVAAFFVLITVMLLAATGMYFFERHAQPTEFRSIPDAMWWAVSALSTVGYGDVTPITIPGKMFGALITIIGVGMVALPTGILASGYSRQSNLQLSRYRQEAGQVVLDGVVSADELESLERLRTQMSMSKQTADQILTSERDKRPSVTPAEHHRCPHCGNSLTQEANT